MARLIHLEAECCSGFSCRPRRLPVELSGQAFDELDAGARTARRGIRVAGQALAVIPEAQAQAVSGYCKGNRNLAICAIESILEAVGC